MSKDWCAISKSFDFGPTKLSSFGKGLIFSLGRSLLKTFKEWGEFFLFHGGKEKKQEDHDGPISLTWVQSSTG